MISELSSYIELFAAVYLTISLDDMLLKRFWTPDYKKEMESAFSNINMPELAKKQVFEKAQEISTIEEKRSRKRGVIMFCLSVLLLTIVGFESSISTIYGSCTEVLLTISLIVLSVLLFLLDGCFLKTGWNVISQVILLPLLSLLSCYILGKITVLNESINNNSTFWEFMVKSLIYLSLLIPVLWQLFRNWIYTKFYLLYIVEQTSIKADEYNYAINYDQSKGDKMTKVSKLYMNFVAEKIAQGNQDRPITEFYKTLLNDLITVDYLPNSIPLIIYSRKMHRKYFPSNCKLKRLSKKYASLQKKPTLEEFCKENNVDCQCFKSYRKKQGKK